MQRSGQWPLLCAGASPPGPRTCLICLPYIGDVNGLASDAVASPPEFEALHSERLLYLPDTMYVHLLEYDVIVPS